MAQMDAETAQTSSRRSKVPILLGGLLMLLGGVGGFAAVYMGMVLLPDHAEPTDEAQAEALQPIAFVPLDPMIISLAGGGARHLRFSAQLEVKQVDQQDVELLKPRVMDVLNGYLRAVAVEDLADPTAMMRLRAQMLRRVQIVTGEGRVRDLLIIEFVLN